MSTETLFTNGKHVDRTQLLGEIVSWEFKGGPRPLAQVRDALRAAGIPAGYAPDMKGRNAFARAIRGLAEKKLARKVDETPQVMRFQITREEKQGNGEGFAYDKEAILVLDKATDAITCPERPDLAAAAKQLVEDEAGARHGSDLHFIVAAYFEKQGDLYAVRSAGGCYFVPRDHLDCSDRVAAFAEAVGGEYRRFTIPAGMGGERSVKESMEAGLAGLLAEYRAAAADFDPAENTELKLNNTIKRLNAAKLKIEGYGVLLQDAQGRLLAELADVRQAVAAKIVEKAAYDAQAGDGIGGPAQAAAA